MKKRGNTKTYYAQYSSQFGEVTLVMGDQGLQRIYFDTGDTSYDFVREKDWVKNQKRGEIIKREIDEYLTGTLRGEHFSCNLDLQGTNFQKQVWQELMKIPHGETRTYKEIAEKIGRPRAVRAVGTAIGKNPIPLIIPCHRVVASGGGLGGYAFGLGTKKRLLLLEQAQLLTKP